MHTVFTQHPEVEKVILYGSRAKGNYREGSDIDLTMVGDITYGTLGTISDELDELLLPYTIDLSVYTALANEALKEHIARAGKVFFQRE